MLFQVDSQRLEIDPAPLRNLIVIGVRKTVEVSDKHMIVLMFDQAIFELDAIGEVKQLC